MTTGAESLTILRSRGRRLAKTVHASGLIAPWDDAKTFDLFERSIANLEQLAQLLKQLERRWDCCIVRGKPADPERVRGVRRLLYPEPGDPATLVEVPRYWLALDIDSLPRPDSIDPADLPSCAYVAIRCLPSEFQQATYLGQATAGHGIKRDLRLCLWCWLSRPVVCAELKYWLRKAPVDARVFGANQLVYTAAPVFLRGSFDPLPARLALIPGCGSVVVPPPARLKPRKRPLPQTDREVRGNTAGLIRTVETARVGSRSNALYWAACRVAENSDIDRTVTARQIEEAAIRAGLSAKEAAGTVRSGLRRGGRYGL